jgi:MFS family permease
MDRTGRSSLLIGSIMAASMSLFAFAYVAAIDNKNDASASLPRGWIVVAACSFQCFTIAAWNCIDVMTSELFPTKVRSTGMGICAATGRIAALLAQFINGATVQHPSLLLCIAAVTLAVGGTTPALLPQGADKTGKVMTDYIVVRQVQDAQDDNEQQPMSSITAHSAVCCELGQSTAAPPSSTRYPYDPLRSYERDSSLE